MATVPKRGFRLPWGGDAHREEPPDEQDAGTDQDAGAAPSAGQHPGGSAAELGEGPFGVAGAGPAVVQHETTANEADDEAGASALREALAPAEPTTEAPGADGTETEESEAEVSEAVATETGTGVVDMAEVEAESAAEAWPTSDRGTAETPISQSTPAATGTPATATPTGGRRDNPLVAGLVRAMREAARTARDETLEALRADAVARAEALRAESAEAENELKKTAETDIAAIKDWSRAELARVREETDARIAARRVQLTDETEAEAAAAETRLERLQAMVEAFESEMGAFFDQLLAEEDPARLAGLAERMPSPPSLEAAGLAAAAAAAASSPGPDAAVGAPNIEAAPAEDHATEEQVAEAHAPEASMVETPSVEAPTVEQPSDAERAGESQSWLERLDADAAAAAEAEALAGLEHQTGLVVTGLGNVAAIATFKGALMHAAGVSAVNVTAGEAGEVLFTVTHDRETDLRAAIGALAPFETQVIADDGTTVSLVARESAS
jgi:hypothetical protein